MKPSAEDPEMPNPPAGVDSLEGSFSAPLHMLAACHRRIAQQCDALQRLLPHLAAHGVDEQAREAAQNIVRDFNRAARDHLEDEELALFPALIESMAGSDAVCLRELTQGLAQEHQLIEAAWRPLRTALGQIAAGEAATLAWNAVEDFVSLCLRHLEREKAELLPMAARLLTDADITRLGRAMREQRGIKPP